MKKITTFAFCLSLALFLAAYGKGPVSSTGGASLPPASSCSAASSGALSTAGGASSAPASSSSSPSSESPSVDTSGWTRRFISLPVIRVVVRTMVAGKSAPHPRLSSNAGRFYKRLFRLAGNERLKA